RSPMPARSMPVEAMACTVSANPISGITREGTQSSVYSALRYSSAGSERMQSPMAPGRMRSRRMRQALEAVHVTGILAHNQMTDLFRAIKAYLSILHHSSESDSQCQSPTPRSNPGRFFPSDRVREGTGIRAVQYFLRRGFQIETYCARGFGWISQIHESRKVEVDVGL